MVSISTNSVISVSVVVVNHLKLLSATHSRRSSRHNQHSAKPMLLIPTEIRPSKLHGLGLFTRVDLKVNQHIAHFDPTFDKLFSEEELGKITGHALWFLWCFGYLEADDGLWHLNSDNLRFMNHAHNPNTYQDDNGDFAVRSIKAGEELTCDYFTFDKDAERKLDGV